MLNSQAWHYCETVLPLVSRTFALNIKALRGDMYRSVLLSYLWCRIIDTVEDAPAFPLARKQIALRAFAEWIESEMCGEELSRWVNTLTELDGEANELDLVAHANDVASCFKALPSPMTEAVVPSIATMARGMAQYQERPHLGRTEYLRDEEDLDRYCYYVAGTVGELLTALFLAHGKISETRMEVLKQHAVSFGLGLQLTNITKDVPIDLSRGWCYVPTTMMQQVGITTESLRTLAPENLATTLVPPMIQKAHGHLKDALQYVLAIPRRWRSIRLFCIWPLWMAMETLALLAQPGFEHKRGLSPKISRKQVATIVGRSSLMFWSNRFLERDFQRLSRLIERGLPVQSSGVR